MQQFNPAQIFLFKRMRNIILKFILAALVFTVSIQQVNAQLIDTLKASFKQPLKFFFRLDLSQSFGSNSGTDIIGLRLGAAQNKRIYYSGGYYFFNTDNVKNIPVKNIDGVDTIVPAQLKLRFVTLGVEYVFFKNSKAQLGIPFNIGYGRSFYKYYRLPGDKENTPPSGCAVLMAGINASYKINAWLGLDFGLGYATTMGTNRHNDQDFRAWIYNLGVQLFFDEIFKMITASKNKNQPDDSDGPEPDMKE